MNTALLKDNEETGLPRPVCTLDTYNNGETGGAHFVKFNFILEEDLTL